jgi:hypothetical protein
MGPVGPSGTLVLQTLYILKTLFMKMKKVFFCFTLK